LLLACYFFLDVDDTINKRERIGPNASASVSVIIVVILNSYILSESSRTIFVNGKARSSRINLKKCMGARQKDELFMWRA